MPENREKRSTPERNGRFLNAWKKFNKVTGFIWLALGVTVNSAFYGLAAIDFGQNYLINRFQETRKKHKAVKQMGSSALAGAR